MSIPQILNLTRIFMTTVLLVVFTMVNTAEAKKFQPVDCDSGDTINGALDQRDYNEKLLIEISGTCDEEVLIKDDDVTLTKDPDALVKPTIKKITVDGARRIKLTALNVDAVEAGIHGKDGATLTVKDVIDVSESGVGILLDNNSVLEIPGTTVESSITASAGSIIKSSGSSITGNITASAGSIIQASGSTITGNVNLLSGSLADLADSTVDGSLDLFNLSTVKGGEILDGIVADLGSTVIGSLADITALRRSMVIDISDDINKTVELLSESAGGLLSDACDSSSTVFGDFLGDLDPTESICNSLDLKGLATGIDTLDSLVEDLFAAIDDILDTIDDLWEAIGD